ncbi:hypothetical protein KR054_012101, partial [Drosophila jambulina]
TSAGGDDQSKFSELADGIDNGSDIKDERGGESENMDSDGVDTECEDDLKMQRVGPGRPRILRTGRPGRPKKQFNILGTLAGRDVQIPST